MLEHTSTENTSIVWKEYHDTFVLCIVASDTTLTTEHLIRTLDLVFHTMVFFLGIEDLLNLKNVERIKKELKVSFIKHFHLISIHKFDQIVYQQVCFPTIDTILDGLSPREQWDDFCDITNCTDIFCCTERQTFEAFSRWIKLIYLL